MTTICLTASPPLGTGTSSHCAHCNQPLASANGRVHAWRSSMGGFFCNEFCAEDDEEAAGQLRRLTPAERPRLYDFRGWGALPS